MPIYPLSRSCGILPVGPEEIKIIVHILRDSDSAGPDDVNPSIVKQSIAPIANILTSIFNTSFRYGVVPNDLKIAIVITVHKSGTKNSLNNYRPISILPYFSKIIEKLMQTRLTAFLDKLNLVAPAQFGFKANQSTFMALLDIQNSTAEAMNKNTYFIVIFLDLAKAFDTVDRF